MSRRTYSTENGQGGGGSRREIREGASREKRGFKDIKINNASVSCCQEAGKMRTENCFLDLATNGDFGKSNVNERKVTWL